MACEKENNNPEPNNNKANIELSSVMDTCGIDSILLNSDYLFSNQDTITLIKREQLLYPLDMRVRKILKNHRYGDYFYVSSYN